MEKADFDSVQYCQVFNVPHILISALLLIMTLSTRIYIQRPPDPPSETTHTLVSTSPANHFVDCRIIKERLPHVQEGKEPEDFEKVFDWVMTGTEVPIEGTNKIHFKHDINLKEVVESVKTGKPIEECKDEEDIGEFAPVEGSEDRQETGILTHPDTGKLNPYIEIWRSLDPEEHTPDQEAREKSKHVKSVVWDADLPDHKGKIVRLGNWVQGVVYSKNEKVHRLSILRSFLDKKTGQWQPQIKYGLVNFPEAFDQQVGDELPVDGIRWKCVESV